MHDLIGDIHGHAEALKALLGKLGYATWQGVWRHPSRTAIFLGDFVDRGPAIAETLSIVRGMVEAGAAQAIMGNHELNAIAFATPRDDRSGEFCRAHSVHNQKLHGETLSQLTHDERTAALTWFRALPMALELDGLRVVHACWDAPSLATLDRLIRSEGGLSDRAVREMHRTHSDSFEAMETVLKGPEIRLPRDVVLFDGEGHPRRVIRARWFAPPDAWTYDRLVFPPSPLVPSVEIPESLRPVLPYYPADAPPLFIGHYWMPAQLKPTLLAPNLACLDWSIARGGRLVAYRWDGERTLENERLIWVSSSGEASETRDSIGRSTRTMPA